jgi:hypothetical protein
MRIDRAQEWRGPVAKLMRIPAERIWRSSRVEAEDAADGVALGALEREVGRRAHGGLAVVEVEVRVVFHDEEVVLVGQLQHLFALG